MKKTIALVILLLVASLLLVACAGQQATEPPAAQPTTPPEQPEPTEPPMEEAALGTEENPLIWAFVPSGEMEDVTASAEEVADMIFDRTGLVVETFVATEYAGVIEAMCIDPPKAHIGSLATFSYIIAADRGCAEAELVSVRFGSASYNGQVYVRTSGVGISVDDFKADDSKLVGTQIGTTNELVAQDNFPDERIQSFEDFPAAILALMNGDVDGVVIDTVSAVGFMDANPGKLMIAGQLTSDEQLGFVFPPGSDLRDAVNSALAAMIEDGTLDALNAKWKLSDEPYGDSPIDAGDVPDLGGAEVTVAVENAYPPFNYLDPNTNEPIGWDYETVAEICNRLNCVPVFMEAAWDGIFPAMEAGEFDWLADGVTITDERAQIIDYSIPYVTIGQVLQVRAEGDEVNELADLKGKTFCGTDPLSTSGWIIPSIEFKAAGVDPDTDLEVQFAGSHDAAIAAVYDGECDAGASWVDARVTLEDEHPDVMEVLKVIFISTDIPNDGVQYVPSLSRELRDQVNNALIEIAQTEEGLEALDRSYEWAGLEFHDDTFYDPFRQVLDAAGVSAADFGD